MPAAIVDKDNKVWRTKDSKYLFNHKALAKVFRAKLLTRMKEEQLSFPDNIGIERSSFSMLASLLNHSMLKAK